MEVETSMTPPDPAATPAAFSRESVPEDIRANKYWDGIQTSDDLFRQFDGLQKKLGRSTSMLPLENAEPAEWDKFFKAAGRPETSDGYEKESAGNADFMKSMRDVFHASGLSEKQGKSITEAISSQFSKDTDALKGMETAQGTRAEEILKTMGGDGSKKIEAAKGLIMESEAGKMLAENEGIDPVSMAIFASVIDDFMKKHVNEGGLGDTSASAPPKKADIQSQITALMTDQSYTNEFHPLHSETKRKVRTLCGEMAAATQ